MSKWIEVPVTTHVVYAIEVEDNQCVADAIGVAAENHTTDGNIEINESDCSVATNPHEAEAIQRHADEVMPLA